MTDTTPSIQADDFIADPADAEQQRNTKRSRWAVLRQPKIAISLTIVAIVGLIAIAPGLFAGWFGNGDPRACDLSRSRERPQEGHPFGFDAQGCDLYANVIYGTQSSVMVALLVTGGCLAVAVVLGGLAGYLGGWVDMVIGRVMDVFFGFPSLIGMIIVLNTLTGRNEFTVAGVLILFSWPGMTRIFRASVLSVRNLEYVVAARELGGGHVRILRKHILPNAFSPLAAVLSLTVGGIITAEAGLTFLGVGLQAPSISWGMQLNNAQRLVATDPHLLLFPAAFLTVTVLAFVLLGDGIRDALDPRRK